MWSLRNDSGAGFMLLEVILSILIIASALVMVIRSYTTSARGSQAARQLSMECLLMEERLFDMDAAAFKDGIKEEEASGDIDGYRWYLSAMPLGDEQEINKVDLKMTRGRHAVKVATYRKYKEG